MPVIFFLMIGRPQRSTQSRSSAASDVYKRQVSTQSTGNLGWYAMSTFEAATTSAMNLVSNEIPNKLAHLEQALASKFAMSLDEADAAFRQAVTAKVSENEPTNTGTNDTVMALSAFVRNELAAQVDALRALEIWVMLSVPQISDGNNFGVEIQEHICKRISEAKTAAKTTLDSLKTYSSERAGAWEKAVFPLTTKKTSTDDTKKTSGGEKPEDTTTHSESVAKTANLVSVSYTHLRAHETVLDLVCRLLLEKKKK
eukprot:TRINITY_DN3230_c0_g1_i4.p1 TRINITY_DN3230_c0_g1~~TRINITY_DN3230_c0_g1_i4.p1  ORF type:complete len:256 (-),score=139.84 TRINITY_DN3230_c0_g1_i4:115-882(-)